MTEREEKTMGKENGGPNASVHQFVLPCPSSARSVRRGLLCLRSSRLSAWLWLIFPLSGIDTLRIKLRIWTVIANAIFDDSVVGRIMLGSETSV